MIGHRMLAYEKELVRLCGDRFETFAMVPTHLTSEEVSRLKKSGVGIRISIEPVGMDLYKSFAYEIFKRRPSVVIALDGNSAGTNVIQEARNGKRKARIFINRHVTSLYSKARTLRGYTAVIENVDSEKSGRACEKHTTQRGSPQISQILHIVIIEDPTVLSCLRGIFAPRFICYIVRMRFTKVQLKFYKALAR